MTRCANLFSELTRPWREKCYPGFVLLRYRYRCYPEPGQKALLAKAFGYARVVWNDALALNRQLYQDEGKPFDSGALMKRCIAEAKRTKERSWLADASHSVLQQSVRDLSQAFRNWWQGKGRVHAPNFKKRGNRQSIRACGKEFYPTETGVRFPRIGVLRLRWSRPLPAEPSSVTIIKECSGKYYASFVVEVEDEKLPPTAKEVGIDLGLASLAVTSDGEKFAPPRFLRSALRKIGRLQRSLSQKVKGSRNRSKARLLLANAQEKVGAKRLDFLHKLSTQFIRENQMVVLEDLHVSGMLKNRRLAKSISDAGWRMFRTLLEYKAERYGREVRVISRWEPTSQRCSACGHQDGKKPLSVRTWTCPVCGSAHDRDINAAKNTLAAGLAERLNACGVKSKSSLLVSDPEAGTRLDQGGLCAS